MQLGKPRSHIQDIGVVFPFPSLVPEVVKIDKEILKCVGVKQ